VKQLLLSGVKVGLVLMSATMDTQRFKEYFADVAKCAVHKAHASRSLIANHLGGAFKVPIKYMEDVVSQLGPERVAACGGEPHHPCASRRWDNEEGAAGTDAQISTVDLKMACRLITDELALDGKVTLVFLPTYAMLEAMFRLIPEEDFSVHSLHSSIDLEECLATMVASQSPKPKVILATSVADSSVTIPNTSVVIDFCRAVEVKASVVHDVVQTQARTTWASRSICDQRKGRTGRMCHGQVIRMVPKRVHKTLPEFETPAIQLVSLDTTVLLLSCSEHDSMKDPSAILATCVDPPEPIMVGAAIKALGRVGAIDREGRPTQLGHLLCNMPVNIDNGLLVLTGARKGLLREAVLLAAIRNSQPHPIARPFAQEEAHHRGMTRFGSPEGRRSSADHRMLAEAAAYLCWRRKWGPSWDRIGDHHHAAEEKAWCEERGLVQTALHAVRDMVNILYQVLHKFQPPSLRSNDPASLMPKGEMSTTMWGKATYDSLTALLRKEDKGEEPAATAAPVQWNVCKYFMKGNCFRGVDCMFSHTEVVRPLCRFHSSGRCHKGSDCEFRHSKEPVGTLSTVIPEFRTVKELEEEWPLPSWMQEESSFDSRRPRVVLVGEGDCSFGLALKHRYPGVHLAVTTLDSEAKLCASYGKAVMRERLKELVEWRVGGQGTTCDHEPGGITMPVTIMHNMDATALHEQLHNGELLGCRIIWWNFPFTGEDGNDEAHQSLIRGFFHSVAQMVRAQRVPAEVEVRIFLQGDQFSRWHVARVADDAMFDLHGWLVDVDLADIPGYSPSRNDAAEAFPVRKPVLYAFRCRRRPFAGAAAGLTPAVASGWVAGPGGVLGSGGVGRKRSATEVAPSFATEPRGCAKRGRAAAALEVATGYRITAIHT